MSHVLGLAAGKGGGGGGGVGSEDIWVLQFRVSDQGLGFRIYYLGFRL